MLELEVFQRDPDSERHTLKFWINGYLSHTYEICKESELKDLRRALKNELLWLEGYIREKGLE